MRNGGNKYTLMHLYINRVHTITFLATSKPTSKNNQYFVSILDLFFPEFVHLRTLCKTFTCAIFSPAFYAHNVDCRYWICSIWPASTKATSTSCTATVLTMWLVCFGQAFFLFRTQELFKIVTEDWSNNWLIILEIQPLPFHYRPFENDGLCIYKD